MQDVQLGDDIFEMAWSGDGITISVRFRIISGNSSNATQGRSTNPFNGMKLPDEIIALGVTRTAAPIADSNAANNSTPSNGQNNTPPTTPSNTLNLTPTTNANDAGNAQADTPVATNTSTDNDSAEAETQEQAP